MENQYIYLLVCLYFLFAGYYKRVSFVESVHQHSDINGQDLHGLHRMTALWGGSCCLLSCWSSFKINKQHCLSHCLFSVINSANICMVRYIYSPVRNTDLVKKHPETNLKNDLNCLHSSRFTYRHEGMSENAANINGSLPTWVNILFVFIHWGKSETALYMG